MKINQLQTDLVLNYLTQVYTSTGNINPISLKNMITEKFSDLTSLEVSKLFDKWVRITYDNR